MKNSIVLGFFLLLGVSSVSAQKLHNIGVAGGYMMINIKEKKLENFDKGYNLGAYYMFVPSRFAALQTGLFYRYLNSKYVTELSSLKHIGMIPLELILFPRFRINVIGGIYWQHFFGKPNKTLGESVVPLYMDKLYKQRNAMGAVCGLKVNLKYCFLRIDCRSSYRGWLQGRKKTSEYGQSYKDISMNFSLELPLWTK